MPELTERPTAAVPEPRRSRRVIIGAAVVAAIAVTAQLSGALPVLEDGPIGASGREFAGWEAPPRNGVQLTRAMVVRAEPSVSARRIGTIDQSSRYVGDPIVLPVRSWAQGGRWAQVPIPWKPSRSGWIPTASTKAATLPTRIHVDLSERRLEAWVRGKRVLVDEVGTGRSTSPTPTGTFVVSDRLDVPSEWRDAYGPWAVGISGTQRDLPAGWSGGNQLALHGIGTAGQVGRNGSAGCVVIRPRTMERIWKIAEQGTPVEIVR